MTILFRKEERKGGKNETEIPKKLDWKNCIGYSENSNSKSTKNQNSSFQSSL